MKTKKLFLLLFIFTAAWSYSFAQPTISFSMSSHNGFDISCNGGHDGWITANVTGGTAPYLYLWSNHDTTQTITGLPASYYAVTVTDATHATAQAGLNLREPQLLRVDLSSSTYPNGYQVSCYHCFNGSITTSVQGGVSSYTYSWLDGPTTQNRSSVGGSTYKVTVTDANGCTASQSITPTEPERSDWTMTGNTGSNPSTNYIGTADSVDFVLRTNGAERMRVKGNGNVNVAGNLLFPNLADTNNRNRMLVLTGIGQIALAPFTSSPDANPCSQQRYNLDWYINSPNIVYTHPCVDVGIGTPSPAAKLNIKSNSSSSTVDALLVNNGNGDMLFKIASDGKVGIGTTSVPSGYLLAVKGKIIAEEVKVKLYSAGWPDYVFDGGYENIPLSELEHFIKTNKHLPGIASAEEVKKDEGVEIGNMQMKLLQKIEELTLYIIEQNRRIEELEKLAKN